MRVDFYGKKGRRNSVTVASAAVAERVYNAHCKILGHSLTTYYRVTIVDPMRGDYIVRDSDIDVLGLRA